MLKSSLLTCTRIAVYMCMWVYCVYEYSQTRGLPITFWPSKVINLIAGFKNGFRNFKITKKNVRYSLLYFLTMLKRPKIVHVNDRMEFHIVFKKKYNEENKFFFSYLPSRSRFLLSHYQRLRKFAARIVTMFGSMLCVQLFSLTKSKKPSQRLRLTDEQLSEVLKIVST